MAMNPFQLKRSAHVHLQKICENERSCIVVWPLINVFGFFYK